MPIWNGKDNVQDPGKGDGQDPGMGDVQYPGKCRSIMLLSHVMNVLERILDGRIRKGGEMEIGEEQQEFRKGRRGRMGC